MRQTASKHGPHPVDIHVGSRVCVRRTLLGLSQTQLGESLGITFQQLQKNEKGTNRIGSSRLYELSRILDVPVQFFFDEMADDILGAPGSGAAHDSRRMKAPHDRDPLTKRETLELVRAFYRIKNPEVRDRFRSLVKNIAQPN